MEQRNREYVGLLKNQNIFSFSSKSGIPIFFQFMIINSCVHTAHVILGTRGCKTERTKSMLIWMAPNLAASQQLVKLKKA